MRAWIALDKWLNRELGGHLHLTIMPHTELLCEGSLRT